MCLFSLMYMWYIVLVTQSVNDNFIICVNDLDRFDILIYLHSI